MPALRVRIPQVFEKCGVELREVKSFLDRKKDEVEQDLGRLLATKVQNHLAELQQDRAMKALGYVFSNSDLERIFF